MEAQTGKLRGASQGRDHWHACGIAAMRKARGLFEAPDDEFSRNPESPFRYHAYMKRSIAALLFAGGEGWDMVRAELQLTEEDELWLERWRS